MNLRQGRRRQRGLIMVVALLGGIGPAALSAVVAGLLLNYFFTNPRFTFTINEPDNLITILVMLVIATGNTALQSVLPAIGRSIGVPDPAVAGIDPGRYAPGRFAR